MTTKKQAERNKTYQRRVKADHGGKKCFGASASTKQKHGFGVLAFMPSRGSMNGRPLVKNPARLEEPANQTKNKISKTVHYEKINRT